MNALNADLTDSAVLVGGYGRAGRSASALARNYGAKVTVFEDDPDVEVDSSFEMISKPGDLAMAIEDSDLVVVSPGIHPRHPLFHDLTKVVSELSFARRFIDVPIIAVTGTNGKTTVTTLITEMMRGSGLNALAVGNIGVPLSDAVSTNVEVCVVEASSFQLRFTDNLAASEAAFLNFSPDHLDWHGSVSDYLASKAKIFEGMAAGSPAFVPDRDRTIMTLLENTDLRVISIPDLSTRVFGGELIIHGERIVAVSTLMRKFDHDLSNFLFAGSMALSAGASREEIACVIQDFDGLDHRMQLLGTVFGHPIYNDSKATTPGAVLCDLTGLERAVLIAGGKNKGIDLSGIAALSSKLTHVVAIGDAAQEIKEIFVDTGIGVNIATSMLEAVRSAFSFAHTNDAIVLSPGCTSWDWYKSYVERGNDFIDAVHTVAGELGSRIEVLGEV